MSAKQLEDIRTSIERHARFGVALIIAVIVGLGGWAAVTEIAGAIIAPGQVVVESNIKKVQHPSGGIVGELLVREGDHVAAGDLLIRLDDTITRASLAIVTKGVDEMMARKARLVAERDGRDQVEFPEALTARAAEPDLSRIIAGESKLFELRRAAKLGQTAQLRQRVKQLEEEVGGATAQAAAKAEEIRLIKRELEGARSLWKKNLISISKLTALEREATRVGGEHGALLSSAAESKGKIAETELEIFQIDRDFGSEVARELAEVDARIGELVERKVAAVDQLKRVDIRAPQAGIVHQLAVHTREGVVTAGETLMYIVPDTDRLTIEARVAPHEIDQLHVGQSTRLRFTAFNQQTTEEINGTLDRVSADVTTDQRSGTSFYTARISIPEAELARLGNLKLLPGMPVEAFLETDDRPVLSYLIKPLQDQMNRALRER